MLWIAADRAGADKEETLCRSIMQEPATKGRDQNEARLSRS
jgi:hypothetical protein